MRCHKCKSFKHISNTAETGQGLCSFPAAWFPVHQYDECHMMPGELQCKDCDRLMNDTACLTCAPEDSAYHNGHLCGGFIDRNEIVITNALMTMRMRGMDYHAKIQELLKLVDEADLPGQPIE